MDDGFFFYFSLTNKVNPYSVSAFILETPWGLESLIYCALLTKHFGKTSTHKHTCANMHSSHGTRADRLSGISMCVLSAQSILTAVSQGENNENNAYSTVQHDLFLSPLELLTAKTSSERKQLSVPQLWLTE